MAFVLFRFAVNASLNSVLTLSVFCDSTRHGGGLGVNSAFRRDSFLLNDNTTSRHIASG